MNVDTGKRGEIVLTREYYGDKLWNKVAQILQILTEGEYDCTVRNDEPAFGIIVIEYCYKHSVQWGGDRIVLMSIEDFEDYVMWKEYQDENKNESNC